MKWAESGPGQPAFRVCLAAGQRLLIEANGDPVLIAKALGCWEDICLLYAEADRRLEVLPAWTAAQCRRLGADQDRWLFEIQRRLQVSPLSPLHSGEWSLRSFAEPFAVKPSTRRNIPGWPPVIPGWPGLELTELDDEPGGGTSAQISVFRQVPGWAGAIIPLRRLSTADAPRVKAHRKLAREGALAPTVLLSVSGLCGFVILDGHDRLAAAIAEDVKPPIAFLTRTDAAANASYAEHAIRQYEHTMGAIGEAERRCGSPIRNAGKARSQAAVYLAEDLREEIRAPTQAWPLSADKWERAATHISPAWLHRLSTRAV